MKKLLTLTALTLSLSANAAFFSGNDLLLRLTGSNAESVLARGYIAGVFDSYHGIGHCAPETVTLGEVVNLTRIALVTDPSLRNGPADVIIWKMLERNWPCAKKGNGA